MSRKDTLDTYKTLVEVHIQSLVQRTAELTSSVDTLIREAGTLTMNIEEVVSKTDGMTNRIDFLHEELRALQNVVRRQQELLTGLETRLRCGAACSTENGEEV